MMAPPAPGLGPWRWTAGLCASLVLHGAGAFLFLALTRPGPLPQAPRPASELRIETQSLAETAAPARAARGAEATARTPGAALAKPGRPARQEAKALAPPAQRLAPRSPPLAPVKAARPAPGSVAPVSPQPPLAPVAQDPGAPLAPRAPGAPEVPAVAPDPSPTPAAPPRGATLPAVAAPARGAAIPAVAAEAPQVTAREAGSLAGPADPVSLAALESFMRPADGASDALHDGLGALLEALPCARVQAEYDPGTGTLALRGHVPEEASRAPLLAALQARIGPGIPVTDQLQILPQPQCGALSGIAAVGLAQSQDQLTNPRLIGPDAQARTFTYAQGQSMVLELAAPDYPAFVYVDYFDARGQVIHLIPNETVPIRQSAPGAALKVGEAAGGAPFLQITVGPPYGQEIAVAFAASTPLYDGTRPLSEPAGPYLEFLKTKVAAARAGDPAFKGEWVYFMVVTHP